MYRELDPKIRDMGEGQQLRVDHVYENGKPKTIAEVEGAVMNNGPFIANGHLKTDDVLAYWNRTLLRDIE